MQAVSVSCASEVELPRSLASSGRPGRYMSSDSGPNAVSAPSARISVRAPGRAPEAVRGIPGP